MGVVQVAGDHDVNKCSQLTVEGLFESVSCRRSSWARKLVILVCRDECSYDAEYAVEALDGEWRHIEEHSTMMSMRKLMKTRKTLFVSQVLLIL